LIFELKKIRKLDKKYKNIAFSILMGLGMSLFMSLVMTIINIGLNKLFLMFWMKAWAIGFLAALPAVLILPRLIGKLLVNIIQE